MPAIHDFQLFFDFCRQMSHAAFGISENEREKCSSIILAVIAAARLGYGTGQQLNALLFNAAFVYTSQLPDEDKMILLRVSGALHGASEDIRKEGYGVMQVFSNSDACLRAFFVACIDDVIDIVWRNAFRSMVTSTSSLSTTTVAPSTIPALLFALIAHAVDAGELLSSLYVLPPGYDSRACDILSMYGAYISSSNVSARDVLRHAIEKKDMNITLRGVGLRAIMWNLSALDISNGTDPNICWTDRVSHNLTTAGMFRSVFTSQFGEEMEIAEGLFNIEFQIARHQSNRFVCRRGVTYVTRLRGRQILAWTYIGFSIFIAVMCALENWSDRQNAFERFKDSIDIVTFLLVSVFGLVKLTSEDRNVLQNLARGRAPVEDIMQAAYFLSIGAFIRAGQVQKVKERLQLILAIEVQGVDWANEKGCCYGHRIVGGGLDAMPAKLETLKSGGFFFWREYVRNHISGINALRLMELRLS